MKTRDAISINGDHAQDDRAEDQQPKPPCTPERGQHDEAQGCALGVPYAVAVSRRDAERVRARRYGFVVDDAACARINPISVQPFHFVLEPYLLGVIETKARVLYLEVRLLRTGLDRDIYIGGLVIDEAAFNHDGR